MITLLRDADELCGGKAATLGALLRAGFAVPPGFVVTDPCGDSWKRELDEMLARVGPGPYAVRSSALVEDGAAASFAGQLHTTLNVPARGVVSAVGQTAASGRRVGATAYASRIHSPAADVVPVLIQQMVAPEASGVLFTQHPVTGADQCVIEATRGLGNRLVEGRVTPERWTADELTFTPDHSASTPTLTGAQALELGRLGRRIQALFGSPQDIEWAYVDGQLWVLQARPLTTHGVASPTAEEPDGVTLVVGTPASPGRAAGRVTVVVDLDDFAQFGAGDVLVCHATSPAWTSLLARAAGVVTETGGMLAHAAIVAREFGIPAVLAAKDAMTVLPDGRLVVVDGDRGTVTAVTTETGDA